MGNHYIRAYIHHHHFLLQAGSHYVAEDLSLLVLLLQTGNHYVAECFAMIIKSKTDIAWGTYTGTKSKGGGNSSSVFYNRKTNHHLVITQSLNLHFS